MGSKFGLLEGHKILPLAGIEKDQQDRKYPHSPEKDRHPQHPPIVLRNEAVHQDKRDGESDQASRIEKNMRWGVRLVRSS